MLVRAQVHVRILPEVLDPQGVAVGETLRTLGFSAVRDVRLGRLIEVTLDTGESDDPDVRSGDDAALRRYVEALCRALLVHEVVEEAEVHTLVVLPPAPPAEAPAGTGQKQGT
jgi:phosphoribosylformylglycinamidine synthase subunit PurS